MGFEVTPPLYAIHDRTTHETLGEIEAISPLEAAAAVGLLSAAGVYAEEIGDVDVSTEVVGVQVTEAVATSDMETVGGSYDRH